MWVGGCVTAPTAWASPPGRRHRSVHKSVEMVSRGCFGAFVYTVATRGSFERPWGRRSVHKWEDRASPRRFGAFVYTVAPREDRASDRGYAEVYTNRWKWPPRSRFGAFVYIVATRVAIRIATRAAPGGTSASTTMACRWHPLAGPSRLVGKTDSVRVAPLPGRHLGRGINPHEPLKSLIVSCLCLAFAS